MAATNTVSLRTVQEEAHCDECGLAFYDGEQAYCVEDTDGSLIWYCEEHKPEGPHGV